MSSRRQFFSAAAGALGARCFAASSMTPKERVDRVLKAEEPDRVPFTFWRHFGLEKRPGEEHARATLEFQRKFRTDLVKVMSDYAFPPAKGQWYELRVEENPFPEQIRALEIIRDGLEGRVYFLETIFNPWNVAEKLSSNDEVLRMKSEQPKQLLEALEAIAESEAKHARKAIGAGAAGIFLAIANAREGIMTPAEYSKFSEPFDKLVFQAAEGAPLNTLHLHGDKVYLDRFFTGWPAAVINYSNHGTGVRVADVRKKYSGVIMGGLDEQKFRELTADQMKQQWREAQQGAGKRFILAPGCSIPNDTRDEEILRLVNIVGAAA